MAKSVQMIGISQIGQWSGEPTLTLRIDEERATAAREELTRKKVIYGHSVPYRNMCRFNAGVGEASYCRSDHSSSFDTPSWRSMTIIGVSSKFHPQLLFSAHYRPSVKYFCDLSMLLKSSLDAHPRL